jgi:hypothetical protein
LIGALIYLLWAPHTEGISLNKNAPTGLITHTYSFKRIEFLCLPHTSPFSPDLMRVAHA